MGLAATLPARSCRESGARQRPEPAVSFFLLAACHRCLRASMPRRTEPVVHPPRLHVLLPFRHEWVPRASLCTGWSGVHRTPAAPAPAQAILDQPDGVSLVPNGPGLRAGGRSRPAPRTLTRTPATAAAGSPLRTRLGHRSRATRYSAAAASEPSRRTAPATRSVNEATGKIGHHQTHGFVILLSLPPDVKLSHINLVNDQTLRAVQVTCPPVSATTPAASGRPHDTKAPA